MHIAKLYLFSIFLPNLFEHVFGNFLHLFDNIWFCWPFHMKVRIKNMDFHSTKNSRSGFLPSNFFFMCHFHSFFHPCQQFWSVSDLRTTTWNGPVFFWFSMRAEFEFNLQIHGFWLPDGLRILRRDLSFWALPNPLFHFYMVFWPSTIKNHTKNSDFWSDLPHCIFFIFQ